MIRLIIIGLVTLMLLFSFSDRAYAHHTKMHVAPQLEERIIVMRHAEKPEDSHNINLAPAGFERARQLVPFIFDHYGKPDYIFAASNSKKSARPYETATPLSQACSVPVDTEFRDQDYKQLAKTLLKDNRFQGRLIVVVWHHGDIPKLAHSLNAKDGSYPRKWKSSIYNQILQFDYVGKHRPLVSEYTEPF